MSPLTHTCLCNGNTANTADRLCYEGMYCFPGGDATGSFVDGSRVCSGDISFASVGDYSCASGTVGLRQSFSLNDTIKHYNGDTYQPLGLMKHYNKFQDTSQGLGKYKGKGNPKDPIYKREYR